MKPEILFKAEGPGGGGIEPIITPAAAAVIEAHPDFAFHAYIPATSEQLANPDNDPFISITKQGDKLIYVNAPGVVR